MNWETTDDPAMLAARVSALERSLDERRIDTGYARGYGPAAVLALAHRRARAERG